MTIKKLKLNQGFTRTLNFMKGKNLVSGFTYVELIVVLSIFAMMTSLVLFNYSAFQNKVDIKVLASDIALKIVQAQKDAMNGRWNNDAPSGDWKPSYGVDFKVSNTNFIYFADTSVVNMYYDDFDSFPSSCPQGECLELIGIKKGNVISELRAFDAYFNDISLLNDLSINFTRPNSKAVFYSDGINVEDSGPVSFVQITVSSPVGSNQATACIQVYSSGRVQVGSCVN